MATAIKELISAGGGDWLTVVPKDGESQDVRVVASDGGITIGHYDAGERWIAVQVVDYGDGMAEWYECPEGDTFGVTCLDEYVVRRTDSAGSLKWFEAAAE